MRPFNFFGPHFSHLQITTTLKEWCEDGDTHTAQPHTVYTYYPAAFAFIRTNKK